MAVLTEKRVADLLREHSGNMAAVGRACGVTRGAVRQFVGKRPRLKQVQTDCREAMIDAAESVLYEKVRAGEAWAVCFFLKCQAKDRGYVEKDRADVNPEDIDLYLRGLAAARPPSAAGGP